MFRVVDESTSLQNYFLYGDENDSKRSDNVSSVLYYYLSNIADAKARNASNIAFSWRLFK